MSKTAPILITDRLVIRRFTHNDIEAIYKIFSDIEVNKYLPWFPLKSLEEAKNFFNERYQKEYQKPVSHRYAICLKNEDIPIGYINVEADDSHDFGYGLSKEYWHKGYMTEACMAVMCILKDDGFKYITATHDVNNVKSGEVMKRIGMVYKYSYKEMWQPKNIPVTFRMYQLNFDGVDRVYKKYWNKYPIHFIEKIE